MPKWHIGCFHRAGRDARYSRLLPVQKHLVFSNWCSRLSLPVYGGFKSLYFLAFCAKRLQPVAMSIVRLSLKSQQAMLQVAFDQYSITIVATS